MRIYAHVCININGRYKGILYILLKVIPFPFYVKNRVTFGNFFQFKFLHVIKKRIKNLDLELQF